tara:strand:- start:34836 stop:35753 length:918 start_codon:yes stop_codon:yes gene_type:complete
MKCLMLTDKRHWAYESIGKNLVKYNTDNSVELSYTHIKGNVENIRKIYTKYDRVLVMGWQNYKLVDFLPKKHTLIGIHGHHAWDNRKTQPDRDVTPPKELVDFLNQFIRVNTVSRKLDRIFRKAGVEKLIYTANGVDSKLFIPRPSGNKEFTVGYSGSSAHDWRKGVTEFMKPAAKKAGVKLKVAMLATEHHITLEEMPAFYQALDGYLCASSSEGFSLSVLEAASCGLPIVSTRVGGCEDLIDDKVNGFLVDRNVDAIADRLRLLKDNVDRRKEIGEAMRKTIEDKYCWSKRTQDWIDFCKGEA